MEKKNLTEEEIGVERLNEATDIVNKIFAAHDIILPEIEVFCGEYDTPYYNPIGSIYRRGECVVIPPMPVIELSIPSGIMPDCLKPTLIYQLSHEYTHSFISEHLLRGSIRIIDELLAAATSHHVMIESGYQWYELKARKGQVISPKKLYDFIKAREKTVYKDPCEVYKKHGCYLGLVSPKINIWELADSGKSGISRLRKRQEVLL